MKSFVWIDQFCGMFGVNSLEVHGGPCWNGILVPILVLLLDLYVTADEMNIYPHILNYKGSTGSKFPALGQGMLASRICILVARMFRRKRHWTRRSLTFSTIFRGPE